MTEENNSTLTFQAKLGQKVQEFTLDTSKTDWYDLWHIHLDMRSEGNESRSMRRACIEAHLELYRRIQEQARSFTRPWQSWIVIDAEDSGQDAVYVHTPKPNQDNFPLEFEGIDWGIEIPELLKDLVNPEGNEIGQCEYNGFFSYFIRSRTRVEP